MDFLSFSQAKWLLPLVILLHVLEELPRFSDWAGQALKVRYTQTKFIVENIVLFVLLIGSLIVLELSPAASLAGQVGLVLVIGVLVSLLLNVIFHAAFTLKTGVYSPGTVTACLLFAPLSIYLYVLAATGGWLTLPVIVISSVLGVVMLPLVVGVVHALLDRYPPISLFKASLLALPLLLFPVAAALVGAATVQKVMVYTAPLAFVPLVLRWVRPRSKKVEAKR